MSVTDAYTRSGYIPAILAFMVVSILGTMFWPAFMSPDSIMQLNQGLEGNYSDHHPPMMSFVWRIFSSIHNGPQTYLIFHLSLLGLATIVLQSCIRQRWLKIGIAFLPLFPTISAYSGALWKDVGFAYSFLLAAMLILRMNVDKHSRRLTIVPLVIALLIYGVGVKYQAQFVLPFMAIWLGFVLSKNRISGFILGLAFTVGVFSFVSAFNKALVPVEKENHSWQFVKQYDLAGISVRTDRNLFPAFVTNYADFSMERVKEIYSPYRVDELSARFFAGAPLPAASNADEREELLDRWSESVRSYPGAYFAHRFSIWFEMVSKTPIKRIDELKSADKVPTYIRTILEITGELPFKIVAHSSRFIVVFPLVPIFLVLLLIYRNRQSAYKLPLLMMTLSGLSLLSCLFVFSMASEVRYIYLTTCFIIYSIPIAIAMLKDE